MTRIRFHHYAWGLLVYNLAVIVWGAYVRASKSGDGCGEHWPSCGGELIPSTQHIPTWIEYTHRVSTAVLIPLIIGLLVWACRSRPRHRAVIRASWGVLVFTLIAGLIGAGLVKYGLVADNNSVTRAVVLSAHLANSFLLLGSLALAALWGQSLSSTPALSTSSTSNEENAARETGRAAPMMPMIRWRGQGALGWAVGLALAGMMLLGVSGAVTALGDTLYPATSLSHGIRQDFSPTAHFLIRLRGLHPLLAFSVAVYLVLLAEAARRSRPAPQVQRLARVMVALFVAQLSVGLLNLAMLAPIWMQLIHLLMADVVWIGTVLFAAATLAANVPHGSPSRREVSLGWPLKSPSTP